MRSTQVAAILLLASLAAAACKGQDNVVDTSQQSRETTTDTGPQHDPFDYTQSVDPDDFRIEATTDRSSYPPGEPVHLTIEVCRTASEPITIGTFGGLVIRYSYSIRNEAGQTVADTSHQVWSADAGSVSWEPQQCRTVDAAEPWDQHYWNQEDAEEPPSAGMRARGDRVEPGPYRFIVLWHYVDKDGEGTLEIETEPFRIEP